MMCVPSVVHSNDPKREPGTHQNLCLVGRIQKKNGQLSAQHMDSSMGVCVCVIPGPPPKWILVVLLDSNKNGGSPRKMTGPVVFASRLNLLFF